ncbi:FecR family protein, partial [Sphingomonas sp. BAUL-RG-20F-R05-02]|uniref:FecR family protein n=1 Tax=Sphingomonas sp. BAUL-RG-20F-R05-02 TaxID=2914830 RepID=UPI001F565576
MRKAFVAMLAASCSSAAIAAEPSWIVSETSGSVQIGHAGVSKVATRGSGIAAGDMISTGPGGRAVLVRGSEYLMVAANSRLRLPEAQQANGFTQMIEDFGNVVFMIKKKMTPHFEVKTPYLAAVVKGTTFSVGVTSLGTSVQVLEGAVDVATVDNGAHQLLLPGAVAQVGANDLFRLAIESNGVRRVIASPGASAATSGVPATSRPPSAAPEPEAATAPTAVAPSSDTTVAASTPTTTTTTASVAAEMPAQPAITTPPSSAAIIEAVYEAPVSLSTVTGGLVNGVSGTSIPDVSNATRVATEASTSVVRAVEIASDPVTSASVKDKTTQNVVAVVERLDPTIRTGVDKAGSDANDVATAQDAAKAASDKAAQDAAAAA